MTQSLAMPEYLDAIAILVGALTGGLYATRKSLDPLGVLLVAFSTGVGGGLIRDVLLQDGIPVLLLNPLFQFYAALGAVIAFFFGRFAVKLAPAYEALDTFMIGGWVLLACGKAQQVGLGPIPTIFIGTVAAVGGGLIRDVLCHDPPELMRPGFFYGLAAFGAATTYTTLDYVGAPIIVAQIAALAAAIILRVTSLHFGITSPTPYDVSELVLRRVGLGNHRSPDAEDRASTGGS
jgi:uncharacterized membrane protein YeiH